MRRAGSSVLGVLLLAATQAPAAEDNSAPLESTKQELRQLESTQKDKTGGTSSTGIKIDTPVLEVRSAENRAIQNWNAQQKEAAKRQQDRQRKAENWLVNGVEQLGKDGAAGTTATPGQPGEALPGEKPTTATDPSDPQYLLKLFDDQKKRTDPKDAPARAKAPAAPDPFAPFLQDWLGSSPVRDQVMDQFRRNNESISSATPAGGNSAADFRAPVVASSGPSGGAMREPAVQAKPNPYLTDLNAPAAVPDMLSAAASGSVVDRITAPPAEATTAPAVVIPLDPLPDTRTPAKGPPPGLGDDKKYFPQLKKF